MFTGNEVSYIADMGDGTIYNFTYPYTVLNGTTNCTGVNITSNCSTGIGNASISGLFLMIFVGNFDLSLTVFTLTC